MTLKEEFFGPSKEDVYKSIASELNGKFIRGEFNNPVRVDVPFKNWIITLDTHVVMELINASPGNHYGGNAIYTRVRAPFIKTGNFQFAVNNTTPLDSFTKLFGSQDIIVGDEQFDKLFTVKGNEKAKVETLFSNRTIRDLIIELEEMNLSIRTQEGIYLGTKLPENVNELFFKSEDLIIDPEKLKLLFQLFSEILEQLCKMNCANDENPNIDLV